MLRNLPFGVQNLLFHADASVLFILVCYYAFSCSMMDFSFCLYVTNKDYEALYHFIYIFLSIVTFYPQLSQGYAFWGLILLVS